MLAITVITARPVNERVLPYPYSILNTICCTSKYLDKAIVVVVTENVGVGKRKIMQRLADSIHSDSPKGHGSGFPGKRRPRGAGLSGRGGRGRSKLKSGIGAVVLPGVSTADISSNKDDEENSMHTTVVLFSSSDKFTLNQDMCVVCGSFGQGAEGRLLACSQCGQCYHPYCVSIKKENLWIVMENQNLVLSGKLWMMKLREWKEQMVSKREKGNHTDQVLVDLWCGKEVELGKGKPKDL
nr:histone-lysine N-methyltransferase 2D-like [Gorilla gorilla gorilla]